MTKFEVYFFFKQWKYFPATTTFLVVCPFTPQVPSFCDRPSLLEAPEVSLPACSPQPALQSHFTHQLLSAALCKTVILLTAVNKVVQPSGIHLTKLYIFILWYITYIYSHIYIHPLAMEWDWTVREVIFINISLFLFHDNSWHGRCRYNSFQSGLIFVLGWLGFHLQNKMRLLFLCNPISLKTFSKT